MQYNTYVNLLYDCTHILCSVNWVCKLKKILSSQKIFSRLQAHLCLSILHVKKCTCHIISTKQQPVTYDYATTRQYPFTVGVKTQEYWGHIEPASIADQQNNQKGRHTCVFSQNSDRCPNHKVVLVSCVETNIIIWCASVFTRRVMQCRLTKEEKRHYCICVLNGACILQSSLHLCELIGIL